jgi:type IV pilus assembly protein PilP
MNLEIPKNRYLDLPSKKLLKQVSKLAYLTKLKTCLLLMPIVLVACADSEQKDIESWMQEQKAKTPVTIQAVYPPTPFVAIPYLMSASADPFDEQKLKRVLDRLHQSSNSNALKPDLARKRDALESYPLDNIKMVGFLMQKNKPTAVLLASGELFNAAVGNYAGQDFGRIQSITEQEVTLKELVQDGSGAWVERLSKMQLTLAGKDAVKDSKK